MTAMAKPVPKTDAPSPTAAPTDKAAAPTQGKTVAQPVVPKLISVSADNKQSLGPSQWGAAAADTGKPLPKRTAPNKAAADAQKQGVAALLAGQLPVARQAFQRAISADAKAYEANYDLGVVSDREGKPDEALQHYAAALRIQPDYELAVQGSVNIMLRRGTADAAVSYVQPIANQWERNLYLQAILADVQTRADRVDDAETTARKALRRDERFVPAIVALAKASLQRGRTELAASMLDQAKEIDPNYAEIYFLQGKAFQAAGQVAQALEAYRKAVDLRPDYAEARVALGIQAMASGNYNDALTQFETAIKLVPTLVAAHLNLADVYRALKRWTDAKREFDQALRMQPQLPEAHFDLALLYMTAGADYPGLQLLDALDRALLEFNTYRTQLGPKLTSDDGSAAYMADIQRREDRERKRIEREKAAAAKAAAKAAKAAPGGAAPAPAPAPAPATGKAK
jgi:tetratricopeptide (TPR) repeat protein